MIVNEKFVADFIGFSDLHLSNSNSVGTIGKNGINSFLTIRENVFNNIISYAIKKKINLIVSTGDLFDTTAVDPLTMAAFHKCLRRIIDNQIFFLDIGGNHESDGMNSVIGAYDKLHVDRILFIDKPKVVSVCGITFYCVPYTGKVLEYQYEIVKTFIKRAKEDRNNKIVLLLHYPIIGCKYDSGTKVTSGFNLRSLLNEAGNPFTFILAGDFHDRQRLKSIPNFLYLGQPYWNDFSSVGKKRGFTLFNCKEKKKKFIMSFGCPRFFVMDNITAASDIDINLTNLIVKVNVIKDVDTNLIYKRCYELGAIKVIVRKIIENVSSSIVKIKHSYMADKLQAVRKFGQTLQVDGISTDELVKVGSKLYMSVRKLHAETTI